MNRLGTNRQAAGRLLDPSARAVLSFCGVAENAAYRSPMSTLTPLLPGKLRLPLATDPVPCWSREGWHPALPAGTASSSGSGCRCRRRRQRSVQQLRHHFWGPGLFAAPAPLLPLARHEMCSAWCPFALDAGRRLLWVVAMGGCYGWLLWVDAACPFALDADRRLQSNVMPYLIRVLRRTPASGLTTTCSTPPTSPCR